MILKLFTENSTIIIKRDSKPKDLMSCMALNYNLDKTVKTLPASTYFHI